ncbi:Gfo/Idh/MocA family protein [Paenibacillus sp. MBLB4367]|uniref:Gfo/Idh/MocA family protein n=1 Tax=Paenibacillus sp. MBLB4367 TaxID=3384767 RepID=UPI003907E808
MKTNKIVIVGCGNMSHAWVKTALARQDAEIVALVDIKEESAKRLSEAFSLDVPFFTDVQEAIRGTNATLVFDVSIPEARKQIVTASLEAGCDVFSEKPMAVSLGDARELAAAAERSDRTYAVMQNRRYTKGIRALKGLLAEGTIGQPGMVCADFFLGPHFGGFRDAMASPLLLDMAIHTFDQARFLIGSDPVSVYCAEFNPAGSWYQGSAAAVCLFEFADGSVFSYRGSWCAEGAPTSWEAAWRITGSGGTAMWDGSAPPYAEIPVSGGQSSLIRETRRTEAPLSWPGEVGHAGCLEEMFAARQAGRRAETDCTDNLKSIAMVFGALESSAKGVKVSLV